jgi:hypothetical protein
MKKKWTLCNYLKITGIINNAFRPQKTLKQTTVKLFSTLALLSLLYGCDNWTIKVRYARRVTEAGMK